PDNMVRLLFWLVCARGQEVPTPTHVELLIIAGVRFERKPCVPGEEFVAKNPVRVEDEILRQVRGVVVLDDAADLDIGKGESLGHILHSLSLHNGLVKNLPVKVDD